MDFIKEINEETLIISDSNIKELYFEEKLLKPIKFMNLNDFLAQYYFSYDDEAIVYIIQKYHLKYDVALEYLTNLYYLEDKKYTNEKLVFLKELKNELDEQNLLSYNEYFHHYLKRVKIILYDIYLDDFLKKTLKDFNYREIKPENKEYKHQVYSFETMESEVNYVAKCIAKLIDDGIKPQKIKLTNVNAEYYNSLTRIFSYYHLKVNIPYKSNLTSYKIVKKFIKLYSENDDLLSALKTIDDGSNIYQELVKVINKYHRYGDKNLLINRIENSFITHRNYNNGIDIVDYLNYLTKPDEYIFMLNFNEGIIPVNQMDTALISDNLCPILGIWTSTEKNKYLKAKTKNIIGNIKNLVITYKLKDFKSSYYPSTLCCEYEVITPKENPLISYSELADRLNLVKSYDNYFKYGSQDDNLDILNNNYEIRYNSYNHKYKGIISDKRELSLSYTYLNTYNKCAFRYYLSEVLKLNIFEENFSIFIGKMIHYVLEKCLKNNDYDPDKYSEEYLKGKTFTRKESFFLEKYRQNLKDLLKQILLEKEYSSFDNALYEQKIDIDYGDNFHFNGVIDKVLYCQKHHQTYVSLIDYKTGNDHITLDYLKYGIDIQLPIYLYLSTHLPFDNIKYCGFYLQKFNLKEKDYRLVGYSNSQIDTLKIMDKQYDNSRIIKGLKTNKDGSFSRYSKLLTDEEIGEIISLTKKNIETTGAKIRHNDFPINPKTVNGVNIGCEYCKFKDICFKDYTDEVEIMGGEE